MLHNLPRPTVFAHRGSSLHAPENTLAAFELAIQHGADAIELDVKLTKDKSIVVIHDQTLDRTTGKSGKVGESTLAELRTLEAGSHFNESFRGEPIPTLQDVFAQIGTRIYYNVELTNYASPLDSLPELVARLVKEHNLEEYILFSSFNPIALIRVRRRLPNVPVGLLALPGSQGRLPRSPIGYLFGYQALHVETSDAVQSFVDTIHEKKRRINVYTVNLETDMRRLYQMGVDGIFTDDPPLAKQVLANLV